MDGWSTRWVPLLLPLLACGSASAPVAGDESASAIQDVRSASAAPTVPPAIEVLSVLDDAPPGSDAAPRWSLAFRMSDGALRPIEGLAFAYVAFRDGVALVDDERALVLVSPSGSRRVLARQSGAPPALGPHGELAYAVRYELTSDLHVLSAAGSDRVLARGLASVGLLAPQADGRVLFVGARPGGIAGVWTADANGARCLTNCTQRTGEPWREPLVPLPASVAEMPLTSEPGTSSRPGVTHGDEP